MASAHPFCCAQSTARTHPHIWLDEQPVQSDRVYARMAVLPGGNIEERLDRRDGINDSSFGFAGSAFEAGEWAWKMRSPS